MMKKAGLKLKMSELDVFSVEQKAKKTSIMLSGICMAVCVAILAGFYWARVNSVMNAQKIAEDNGYDGDGTIYDMGCFAPEMVPEGDKEDHAKLGADIFKDACEGDSNPEKCG